MSMSKKNFIAMADAIIEANRGMHQVFTEQAIEHLADFCRSENNNFKRERWLDYIAGRCGKNGGAVKKGDE